MIEITVTQFRDALNRHLDESGVSIAELARRTGVSKPLIDKLHQCRVNSTSVEAAVRIARFFNKDVEEFMGLAERKARMNEAAMLIGRLTPEQMEVVEILVQGLLARRR